jgi:SP family myo-inositol transporter-like MFS transporter 13
LNAGQLSIVVAAVLLGSVISTLFAGALADWIGRKPLMTLSGLLFVGSIPIIALSHGYGSLVLGRLLQGMSAGLIGVVVPLYLAECLSAANRGKGTAIFQWLLTLGIFAAALVGMFLSFASKRWPGWAIPLGSSRLKIRLGGASSGFRCPPVFSS